MEKLIELLNERIKEEGWTGELSLLVLKDKQNQIYICSKNYGFIKRLVENNKIDIERLHKIVDYRLEIKENYVNAHDYNSDCLLMILSIEDNPIEFLCEILK